MGVIISSSHSVLKPDNKIKITNFRGLKYIDNDGVFFNKEYQTAENVTGLLVIVRDCKEYFFEEMTIDKFFEILKATKNTRWQGRYKREVLVCRYCGGSGRSDWVKNIRKSLPDHYDPMDRCGYVKMKSTYKFCTETAYYLTQAKLKTHEEHCEKCMGTGMYFVNKETLIDTKLK